MSSHTAPPCKSRPPTASFALTLTLALALLALASCATTTTRPGEVRVDDPDAYLISTSGAFELHVRDGRVLEVEAATPTREDARTRQIRSLDDLRTAYERSTGQPLPPPTPGGSIQVNGWIGAECVRLGRICGQEPHDKPRVMLVIRFD